MHQIEANFGRTLHYFDRIFVAGPSAEFYSRMLENPPGQVLAGIFTHLEALLYIRKIGAEEVIKFQPKIPVPSRQYAEHAKLWGINPPLECANEVTEHFYREGEIVKEAFHGSHWHFSFRHEVLDHDLDVPIWQKKRPKKRKVAQNVYAHYAAMLTSDVATARMMRLPVGSSANLHARILRADKPQPSLDDVALNLHLPVLEGLPVGDIIQLREDEHEHFSAFQTALTAAMKERLKEGGSAEKTADAVYREVIEPALSDIRRRLGATEKSLSRKVGLGLLVGSAVTTVGSIESVPIVIGAGLAAAATGIAAAHKYFDDKKDIELSDMYFLWLLEKRYSRHHH
ncbi:hypothetical protein [Actinomadura geliboluensis]